MLLYMHIPFCDSKCHYCSFNSFTKHHNLKRDYMQALLRQLEYELERFHITEYQITSVFVGGGTPSCVEAEVYEPIFAYLAPLLSKDCEITFEANPNSASFAWLQGIKSLGATRVSFGVQSFDANKLRFLGRAHDPKDAIQAIENAHKAGFAHINCDIIYNVKGDTKELLQKDIAQALALPIDHISAYALTIEENTPFARGGVQSQEDFSYFVRDLIPFEQYEVSNFGRYRSRHNIGYWQLQNYIGIGAGAVGFYKDKRYYPTSDLFGYIADPLHHSVENLSPEEIRTEKIFLGLRSCVGIDADLVDKHKASLLCQEGKLICQNGRYYNPNYFLADEIALFLL